MISIRLTILCWYLLGVIARNCQSVELDANANLENDLAYEDLKQALDNAGLQVVDTQRSPVNHRTSNTNDAAEAEQTEVDQQTTNITRTDGSEEGEKEEEEEDDEEKEEEWLPVYIGGKQKINGQHREGKRVRRDGDGKSPELQEKAANGQLQYTTLDQRNNGEAAEELTEAGNGETDASGEDKAEKDDNEASKDDVKLETDSEDELAKEGEPAKEQDGEVNGKAEAPSDDDMDETSTEDTTQNEKETSKQDDASNESDTPNNKETSETDDTSKKDNISNLDNASANDEEQKMNEKSNPTQNSKKGKKPMEESKARSRIGKTAQKGKGHDSAKGSPEEHLLEQSKGQDKEPADYDGSGDEENEGNIFIKEPLSSTDDTSDDSPAADEDEELIGTRVPDDEAKKHQTVTLKENAENSKDKQPSIEGDKKDNEQDSRESDKDDEKGSGEEENQNSEPENKQKKEPGNEKEHENENGERANKKQLKGSNWKYYGAYGPGNWSREFSGCIDSDQQFQSPISIVPEQTRFDDTHKKITFSMKHTDKPCNSILFNEAQTAKVIFENMAIHVIGLDKVYQVAEVQFHWGSTNNDGSEHVIAGKRYPLEMQVLCYDEENFPDLVEAEWAADNASYSIVVLATLFELSNDDNPLLSSIVENLKSIQSPGENISIPSLNLKGLLPAKSDYFYRYSGSLTSPPCQSRAEWIVFHERQTVSPSQLEEFRQLHDEEFEDGNYTTIDYNWRPVQPLNGRVVTRYFPKLKNGNPNTKKPTIGKMSVSSSHRISAIDVFVCTLLFVCKLFLG